MKPKLWTGKKVVVNLLLFVVIIGGIYLGGRLLTNGHPLGRTVSPSRLANFAKYLTEKGVVMYGAYWCSHCQNQKKVFGDAFQYITYVECTQEPKRCLAAGVKGYPTWTIPKNATPSAEKPEAEVMKIEGEITLDNLIQATEYDPHLLTQ